MTARLRRAAELSFLLGALLGCASGPPAIKLHVSGKELALTQFRGRVVLLNFWAVWCKPCMEEIPQLFRSASEFGDQVSLVAVYAGPEANHRAAVETWLARQPPGFAKHISWGNPTLLWDYEHRLLPTTYVLGRSGQVVEVFVGSILGEERISMLRHAIERGLAPPRT